MYFKLFLSVSFVVSFILATLSDVNAIGAWARKYGMDCNICHSAGYKLTKAGQQFLRLGHRMPGTGDENANMSDYFSITGKERYWAKTSETSSAKTTSNSFEAHALSIYTGGPFNNGFSYFAEMYVNETSGKTSTTKTDATTSSDFDDYARTKMAEAYLQYNTKGEDIYTTARIGQIVSSLLHLHGVGARLSYSRPYVINSGTVGDNPYKPFARQFGASVGQAYKGIFAELGIVNGTGGKQFNRVDVDETKDVWLTADYTLDENGSIIGLYIYKGFYPTTALTGYSKGIDFSQYGLLGNYTLKEGSVVFGYFTGSDSYQKTSSTEKTQKSNGYFVELQHSTISDMLNPYLRYEFFDSDADVSSNEVSGPVLGLNYKPLKNGRFVLELQQLTTANSDPTKEKKESSTVIEFQFMF